MRGVSRNPFPTPGPLLPRLTSRSSAGRPVRRCHRPGYPSQSRLETLAGVPILPVEGAILDIAEEILRKAILPRSASVDALHIAMVAHHQVDSLLTWNCTHIANARILPKVFGVLDSAGLARPIICTPEELLNDDTEIS
jgi:hypothetical protein